MAEPATSTDARFPADFQRRTILKVSWRLLPLVVVAYLVAYIDRTNIAFAALTMNEDLGFSASLYGLGAGIFFIGYALFEVPSNLILEKVGARLWIARIMLTWGIVSGLMATVSGPVSFLVLRFLLGVAEAGFFPGMILYFTYWFPARYRARVISTLFIAVPASNALAAALSGAILEMDGIWGLRGWQWLFVLEALPAIALAFVVLGYMTDRPAKAGWLNEQEKEWLETELQAERSRIEKVGRPSLLRVLTDRRVIVLSLIYFALVMASYGIAFFLPQIVKMLGHSNIVTGLLTAIPYVVGLGALLLFGYSSDRRGERRKHLAVACIFAAVGLFGVGVFGGSYWVLVATCLAAAGIYGSRPAFWPMPSMFLTGAAAAGGIAFINSIGNLGGYVGPFIIGWIKESTGSFELGLYFLGACALGAAVLTHFGRRAMAERPQRP
jgi:ACS family tartrate transporter-like MFS transporter